MSMEQQPSKQHHLDVFGPHTAAASDDPVLDDPAKSPPAGDVDPEALRVHLVEALRTVYDPEIPVNVYDLGLVYQLDIDGTGSVQVQMTLTAPACPVADHILAEVHRKLCATPEVSRVQTRLVWDPPWSMDRMSEAARLELGIL